MRLNRHSRGRSNRARPGSARVVRSRLRTRRTRHTCPAMPSSVSRRAVIRSGVPYPPIAAPILLSRFGLLYLVRHSWHRSDIQRQSQFPLARAALPVCPGGNRIIPTGAARLFQAGCLSVPLTSAISFSVRQPHNISVNWTAFAEAARPVTSTISRLQYRHLPDSPSARRRDQCEVTRTTDHVFLRMLILLPTVGTIEDSTDGILSPS